jgi:hypothetical protein
MKFIMKIHPISSVDASRVLIETQGGLIGIGEEK